MTQEKYGPFECVTIRYERLARHEVKGGGSHRRNVIVLENARIREIFPVGRVRRGRLLTPAEVVGLE